MRALLVQSPATSPWVPHRQWEPPSVGLATIAGQIDNHEVRILDAVVWRSRIKRRFIRALEAFRPQVVGFSAMTFQYASTLGLAYLTKQHDPSIRTVLGGYHATLCHREIGESPDAPYWDFLIRGEADRSLGALLDSLEAGADGLEQIGGLSFYRNGRFVHNPSSSPGDLSTLRIPARHKRLLGGHHIYFRKADVVETSRGCLHACNFCSIRRMYGRSYRTFPLDRVAEDIEDAYRRGAREIVLADDNITLDMDRFEALCDRIIGLRLRNLTFTTQASPIGFARRPEIVKKMVEAGFMSIFLGIENSSENSLRRMQKPGSDRVTRQGVEALQRHDVIVIAGLINGLPHDDAGSIRDNYRFIKELGITSVMDQILTPYPGTPLRQQMLEQGLIDNRADFRWYDGYFANVRTENLKARELSYLRWTIRREILGMWRPTPADYKHFAGYSWLWELGLRHLVWLSERTLERLLGLEGRYRLQMKQYMRLNDFGIGVPGSRQPDAYLPI